MKIAFPEQSRGRLLLPAAKLYISETDYIQADLRDPGTILKEAARTLDFTRPVAVLLVAILHFIPDAEDPYAIVNRLMDAVPSGSPGGTGRHGMDRPQS